MSDIVTGKVFVDGEKGITATKLNQIQSLAVVQPDFYLNKATSSTLDPTDVLLELKGTGSYAQITGANLISSVSASVSSVRPRNYNAIGNPTFEVDQRQVGIAGGWAGNGIDRWSPFKVGATLTGQIQQIVASPLVLVPGTNFAITGNFLRMTLSTAQASLAASDQIALQGRIEGPQLRELISDVHSIQLLVRSSVAGLSFGVSLRDVATAHSLCKLCTISSANTWTLITLPNLPVWSGAATWALTPGSPGYYLNIQLAAGSTLTAPANDTWQNGNFLGALGQSNFANNLVNSTFDIAFVQHEPGALCTTPIDKPFAQNLDECLRYFQKTYDYGVALGATTSAPGMIAGLVPAGINPVIPIRFGKPMAKDPTVTGYSYTTGAINTIRDSTASLDKTITATNYPGVSGFSGFNVTSPNASAWQTWFHYIADTGW